MRHQFQSFQSQIQGWSECFQSDFLFDQQSKPSSPKSKQQSKPVKSVSFIQSYESNLKNLLETYGESSQLSRFSPPKPRQQIQQEEEAKLQRGKRSAKVQKGGQYSKNYRQKKKEHMKMLEQENSFLKKKVEELQIRLRQKQMELSRIKFAAKEDDYNLQKFNEELTQKLSLIADHKIESHEAMKEERHEKKPQVMEEGKKMSEFLKFFEVYGLAGVKSKQILEYYVNEFLQNVIRDREKYFFLKCLRKDGLKQNKTSLDSLLMSFSQQITEEQAKNRIKLFSELRPVAFGLMEACRDFYRTYQKVISLLEKSHELLKFQFSQNLDLTKKRLRIILWFQQNQYLKQVRNLRAEWIDMIRSQNEYQEETGHGKTKKKAHQ